MKQKMNGKYFIKTFGCQANKNESERLATYFEQEMGLGEAADWREPGVAVILLNTCSVRKAADDRVYGLLRALNKHYLGEAGGKKLVKKSLGTGQALKKKNLPKVILTGCMSRYQTEKLQRRYPVLSEVWKPGKIGFGYEPKRKDRDQAFVQISTGCNSFCTYCVVPYARGREKSRELAEILAEVRAAVDDGYKEITLLGQNVNSWGLERIAVAARKNQLTTVQGEGFGALDLPRNVDQYELPKGLPPFVKLLREISAIAGVEKIRFMTSNPWDFYDELIEEIGSNQKIDSFVHLPVQSGSDSVLARMNRGYTQADYLKLVKKLRAARPDVQIGTDIIVGFSGETEADFEQTVELVKKVDFKVAFVAIYSVRPGTVAAKLYKDDVPFAEKKRRWEILDEMINKANLEVRPKIV